MYNVGRRPVLLYWLFLLAETHFGPFFAPSAADPPMIQHCPGEVTTEEHKYSMDMVPCYADGNPAVTVQWYFGGNLIDASKPLTRGHSGTYKAVAENRLGRSEASVIVKVKCKWSDYFPSLPSLNVVKFSIIIIMIKKQNYVYLFRCS